MENEQVESTKDVEYHEKYFPKPAELSDNQKEVCEGNFVKLFYNNLSNYFH